MTAADVINAVIASQLLGSAFVLYRLCRIRRPSEQQRAAAARARAGLVPPGPDAEPGTDDAVQDACELLWAMPSYTGPGLDAGLDRLRQAIHDEQPKEGQ